MPSARTRLARRAIPIVLMAIALLLATFSIRAQADVERASGTASDAQSAVQEVVARATQPVRDLVGSSGFLDPTGRLASAYPRGLPIGVVSEARQSDANTYKNVLVVPWVDLGSFANVVILTGGGTS